ncbi:DALR anticodon-binding domain-containing protein 3 [Frankliniella fusca]|uniref:DALR anticodon-binding domain-containing protein 3 n=1 Tax=Frankliniella fusca TaxID=407009 RepID=A0AAE1LS90_9NEOP|nr:DALR anticodon-binding domain-containing protein 3 [Frankliniella fusca]
MAAPMPGTLVETLRNIYKYLGNDDPVVDENAIFQEPRMSRQNPSKCDLCLPLIRHGGCDTFTLAVLLFPEYKTLKMKIDIEKVQRELPNISKSWMIPIKQCSTSPNSLCILLHRSETFNLTINHILAQKAFLDIAHCHKHVFLGKDSGLESDECIDLTKLRTILAFRSLANIFSYLGYVVETRDEHLENLRRETCNKYHVCHKSLCLERNPDHSLILCGAVLDKATGAKASGIGAQEYYRNKTAAFKKTAEGRETSSDCRSLGEILSKAEVAAELLWVKLHDNVSVNLLGENEEMGVARGATFLLYNHVRLRCIRKKFDQEVENGNYQRLPSIDQIDFGLLTQNEEWDLLLLIIQFPFLLIQCVSPKGKFSLHPLLVGLDKICRTFSVYYRRVRVLTESRPQLLPVMYARLYLLHSVEHVLGLGLSIFNMKTLDYM